MITLIAAPKGGTGKSSIATNLSAWLSHQKLDVMLLDADVQRSAKGWSERRNEAHPDKPVVHCAQATGDLYKPAKDLATRYDHLVIDTGSAYDSREIRTGLVACGTLVIPVRASMFDLETVTHAAELVTLARDLNPNLKAYVVLSIAPTNTFGLEIREAKAFLSNFEAIELCPVVIHERTAYRDAALAGLSVIETRAHKAKAEIQLLAQFLFN